MSRPRQLLRLRQLLLADTDVQKVGFLFEPYPHQLEALQALQTGRNAVLVWHRRAGKDLVALNYCITQAVKKAGAYYYLFPTYAQAKKVWWDGMTNEGLPYRAFIPKELIEDTNEAEMQILLKTHDGRTSIIQAIGTENIDRVVGTNPMGAVYSEFSLHNPRAKSLLDPIFAANGGWQVFVYTPRGRNHGWKLYQAALRDSERWYASLLTVEQTKKSDGSPIISKETIARLIAEGEDPDLVQQEYYCSFEGAIKGSFYGSYLGDARATGRVGNFPYSPGHSVRTAWDLGVGVSDTTVIWFYQKIGRTIRLIDRYENHSQGAEHYAEQLARKPWAGKYGLHLFPHDLSVLQWGAGKTREDNIREVFQQYLAPDCRQYRIVEKYGIADGIAAVRRLWPDFQFNDAEKLVEDGLGALAFYHREFDEDRQMFRNTPEHDWSSNTADALRYLAVGETHDAKRKLQTQIQTGFNPFTDYDEREDVYEHNFNPLVDSVEEVA